MVAGIALFGVLTANVAAFFIEQEQKPNQVTERLDEVLRRLEELERRLDGVGQERSAAALEGLEPPKSAAEVDRRAPPS